MNREDTLRIMAQHLQECQERYGINKLWLFGSAARGEAGPESDVDILVEFDGPADSRRYFGLQFFLEDLLRRPVDLVTTKALRPELQARVEKERISV